MGRAPGLALTTAVYRLDRTNTRSTDPNDPTRIVQTGSQRTNGFELGVNGRLCRAWRVAGGYAYQDAFVTSATAAARGRAGRPGAASHVVALEQLPGPPAAGCGPRPHLPQGHVRDHRQHGHAAGIHARRRGGLSALTRHLRLQANLENLLDKNYWINADSNTNMSPGFPGRFGSD